MKGSARVRLRNGRIRLAEIHWYEGMASASRNSSASGTSTRRKPAPSPRFAVCIRNDGYEASLERNKIYAVLRDDDAEREGDLRVVDESGEDYLFSAVRFVAIEVGLFRWSVLGSLSGHGALSVKVTSSVTRRGTGTPSRVAGANRHCLAACTAA